MDNVGFCNKWSQVAVTVGIVKQTRGLLGNVGNGHYLTFVIIDEQSLQSPTVGIGATRLILAYL